MRCAPKKLRTSIYGAEYVRGNGEATQMQSIPQNCTGTIYPPALTQGDFYFFLTLFRHFRVPVFLYHKSKESHKTHNMVEIDQFEQEEEKCTIGL